MTRFKKPQGPSCFGYGRLSTALPDLTPSGQQGLLRDYWREHLEPAGVEWGGFLCDEARQGNTAFAERREARKIFARAQPGDHVVVCRLDRSLRSAADGDTVIQALAARNVQFHSPDLPTRLSDAKGLGVALVMRAVADPERAFVSERTLEVIADRRSRGLPITGRALTCPPLKPGHFGSDNPGRPQPREGKRCHEESQSRRSKSFRSSERSRSNWGGDRRRRGGEEDRRDGADYCRWKKKFGGLRIDQSKRLKELEKENSRLKRLLADAELDKAILRAAASERPWAAQLNF